MRDIRQQIAIDGPAASGKSTVARRVAVALDGWYVNTGHMYRALTWLAIEAGIDPASEADRLGEILTDTAMGFRPGDDHELTLLLNGDPVTDEQVRRPDVTARVSYVAREPVVREWLRDRQRASREHGLIVMEGRDIGTVIFPDARHKFFLTATPRERARRRLEQEGENLEGATLDSVAAEIAERDRLDSTRAIAPLRPADDAEQVDTTGMTIAQVVDHICRRVREHWHAAGEAGL